MKGSSIRFKFFAAISAVAVVFIGVLIALNVFFYDDYSLMTRRSELRDAYRSACAAYAGNEDNVFSMLDALENRSSIRLAVATADGRIYTPARASGAREDGQRAAQDDLPALTLPFAFGGLPVQPDEQRLRGYAVLLSLLDQMDWDALSGRGSYRTLTLTLPDGARYLCLAGVLDEAAGRYLLAYMPHAVIEQNSSFNLLFLLIAGGCALLICLGCGYLISRQFTRPLIEMADAADHMAELDFSRRCPAPSGDEIGRLGQSLNRLSAYLEQAVRELRQSNDRLAQEVRERERIDGMRREFIVNVSHELKTPIALIQGYAEGLTAGVADDPEDRKFYCDTIADEAARMNRLVMQLLSLSKLEVGAEPAYYEDVDLRALCLAAIGQTAVLCEGRGLRVAYTGEAVSVRTDGGLIDQVVRNYLSNAIRYTEAGGRIELGAARTGTGARLTVFNEGDGLPEGELDKIWEKFYRTDRARSRELGGTGIGLSLVRAIADTLQGACGAENVPGGIVFFFDLPAHPPEDAPQAP